MSYPESNEQFNRQQGEELIAALTGEEAPDLGYPATNEQFNREQGNRLIEAVKNFSPGGDTPDIPEAEAADIGKILGVVSDGEEGAKYGLVEDGGLPDPSTLTDGTALVAVNGEWKKQEGYGYTGEPAFEPIAWDGDTEGRDTFEIGGKEYCRVADALSESDLVGAMFSYTELGETVTYTIQQSDILNDTTVIEVSLFGGAFKAIIIVDYPTLAPVGTYFPAHNLPMSLTAPSTVHQFDPALIPGVVPAAPSEDGTYVLTCTIADGEAVYSWETNA